jgi:hypothetical protein
MEESTKIENCVISQGKILGVVFDISLRHQDGQRVLDGVKEGLINFVKETMGPEDVFYLYHPQIVEPVEDAGVFVSAVGNYETDGYLIDLRHAMEQTSYVMAAEDEDCERVFMYITDRVQINNDLKRVIAYERRDQTGCDFLFIGVGNHYDRKCLSALEADNSTYVHLDNASELYSNLMG